MEERLAKLHLECESCPYNLGEPLNKIPNAPKSLGFGKKPNPGAGPKKIPDTSTLYIEKTKIYDNLPATSYKVNQRTPLEWFVIKSQFSKNKTNKIINYPLREMTGEEIRKIIECLVHVGIESDRLMDELAKEDFEQREWTPAKVGLDVHMPDGSGNEFQSRLA